MNNLLIEIRTGSDSDIPKIKETYKFFDSMNINYSARILSAHRTPMRMIEEANKLEERGFRVSVAAAGGSAHLAGMTASETSIPVVALPVLSSQGGVDSILSMIQMPPGIPNGCVGINSSKDAAVLALRIASLDSKETREKLSEKIQTEIISNLDKAYINILSEESLDTSILDIFSLRYKLINDESEIDAPIVIYNIKESSIEKFPNNKIEQISIISIIPEKNIGLSSFARKVSGPYAWVGVGRLNNAFLYSVQILGLYFRDLNLEFKKHRKELEEKVVEKDKKLEENGIKEYL